MKFRDLQEAIARLASDPRIHSTTPVEVAFEVETVLNEDGCLSQRYTDSEQEPLLAIAIEGGALVLAATRHRAALAR